MGQVYADYVKKVNGLIKRPKNENKKYLIKISCSIDESQKWHDQPILNNYS